MAQKIELRGVLDQFLGARWCLRGFAPLGVLAKISQFDDDYQRSPDNVHVQDLMNFYTKDTENLFFPELILCLPLDIVDASVEEDAWLKNGPLAKNSGNYGKYWQHRIGKVFAKFYTVQDNAFRTASFVIPDDLKCLYRIDGNHRLVAAERVLEECEKRSREGLSCAGDFVMRQIPFCIIIFPKGTPWKEKSAKYFSNINFKALPLSKELNIKGIIKNKDTYSDEMLFSDDAFGASFVFCRVMYERAMDDLAVKNFICDSECHCFLQELGESILSKEATFADVESLYDFCGDVYKELKTWLSGHGAACANYNRVAKAGAFYYHWQDRKSFSKPAEVEHGGGIIAKGSSTRCVRFCSWIESSGIEKTLVASLKEVLRIFDSVYENLPKKLFLARWYPESGVEKRRAEARFEALQKVAKAENLELIDMEHMRCGSFSIRDAIDQAIPTSDLFVADMTGLRPNVMVEIGMALHHLPKNRVLFYMQKAEDVPGMKGPIEDPPFDLSGYSYVKIVDSAEIESLVRPRIKGILNGMRGVDVVGAESRINLDENGVDLETVVAVPVEADGVSASEDGASARQSEDGL